MLSKSKISIEKNIETRETFREFFEVNQFELSIILMYYNVNYNEY